MKNGRDTAILQGMLERATAMIAGRVRGCSRPVSMKGGRGPLVVCGGLLLACGGKSVVVDESSSGETSEGSGGVVLPGTDGGTSNGDAGGTFGEGSSGEGSSGIDGAGAETAGIGGNTGGGGARGETGGTSSGGPGDVGGAGATSGGPCPLVFADCLEENAVSCDETGVRWVCDACLVNRKHGSCARMLVADKENDTVCAVVGDRELYCEGGVKWTGMNFPQTLIEVPEILAIYGDTSGLVEPMPHCVLTKKGEIACQNVQVEGSYSNCTEVAISEHGALCASCSGALTCERPDLVIAGGHSVELDDLVPYYLTPEGLLRDQYNPNGGSYLDGPYTDFVVTQGRTLCGLHESGVTCQVDAGEVVEVAGDFVSVSAGYAQLCLLGRDGTVTCRSDEASVFERPSYAPEGCYKAVVSTSAHSCGLSREGEVRCWDAEGELPVGLGPFL